MFDCLLPSLPVISLIHSLILSDQVTLHILNFDILVISLIIDIANVMVGGPHGLSRLSHWDYFQRLWQSAVGGRVWEVVLVLLALIKSTYSWILLEFLSPVILHVYIRKSLVHGVRNWHLLFFARRWILVLLINYEFGYGFLELRYIVLSRTRIKKHHRLTGFALKLRIILLMPHLLKLIQLIILLQQLPIFILWAHWLGLRLLQPTV